MIKREEMTSDNRTEPIINILQRFRPERASLIPALQTIQVESGYLPHHAMLETARYLGIAPVDVYEVATFYRQFRLTPPGRHSIRVCKGTACHMKGGNHTLDAWQRKLGITPGETSADGEYDLDTVACLGACHLAPVSVVDGNIEKTVDPVRVDGIMLAFEREKSGEGSLSRD